MIPLKRCFLKTTVKIITGTKNITVPAAMAGQSNPPSPIMVGIKGGAGWASVTVTNAIPNGQWVHLAFVKDSNDYLSVYQDGTRTYNSTTYYKDLYFRISIEIQTY